MKCALCGWMGERRHREVNYSVALAAWVCARCFHSPRYDEALAAKPVPVWL